MRTYVVRRGDFLTRIALREGFDAKSVWQLPENGELRDRRPNPEMILPGDVLHIPDAPASQLAIQPGTTNRYHARVPTMQVRVRVARGDALANEDCVVDGLPGEPRRMRTDGSGMLTLDVPVHHREVFVCFPRRRLTLRLEVGALHPSEESAGLRQRLRHLGTAGWPAPGIRGDVAAAEPDLHSLRRFHRVHASAQPVPSAATGELRDTIVRTHGG